MLEAAKKLKQNPEASRKRKSISQIKRKDNFNKFPSQK